MSSSSAFNIPQMENEEFFLWQSMLERRTGLWLPETRKAFLATSLNRNMRAIGIAHYHEYYEMLDDGSVSNLEWAKLVDSLTVHETCFYRDKDSLRLVSNYCRNKANDNDKKESTGHTNIQIWSVGCSTGEESYTLAFEMEKLCANLQESMSHRLYYGVTGVDVSYPSLAIAREGIYTDKHLEFIPETSANCFFKQMADGHIQVNEQVKKRTCFMQSNILELDNSFEQLFDVIYCQNVLIYFRNDRKELAIKNLVKRLKPGGLLVLGHGEIVLTECMDLKRVDNKLCLAFIRRFSEKGAKQITSRKSESV